MQHRDGSHASERQHRRNRQARRRVCQSISRRFTVVFTVTFRFRRLSRRRFSSSRWTQRSYGVQFLQPLKHPTLTARFAFSLFSKTPCFSRSRFSTARSSSRHHHRHHQSAKGDDDDDDASSGKPSCSLRDDDDADFEASKTTA